MKLLLQAAMALRRPRFLTEAFTIGIALAFLGEIGGPSSARAAAESVERKPLTLVSNGTSSYSIVYAAAADEPKITEAAELLQRVFAEATGVELPIFPEPEAPEGPAIYLGYTEAARNAGLPIEEVTGWSYHNAVVGEDLFLVGQDIPGLEGHGGFDGYAGSLKAVTAFLERHAGVRFILPGPLGIHVPTAEEIVVDGAMEEAWSPLFQFVTGRRVGFSGGRQYDPYGVANHFHGRYANDTEIFQSYGSHSYPHVVSAEKYFDSNPEYFALLRGERTPHLRNQLCISNPEVHELFLKEMEAQFDAGFQMVMLGQSDGYRECQCDNCQAVHPEMGEKIWIIHRGLAEEMLRRRPGGQVVLLSYVSTTKPPVSFDSFPENVVILNNRYVPEYFEAWEDFQTPRIVYLANWTGRHRQMPPRYVVNQVRLFKENGVVGIYLGGGLDCGTGSPWGLNGPAYYAFGKALHDPSRDADELEREYIDAAFGETAESMREFFETFHRRLEVKELLDRRGMGVPDRRYRGHPLSTKPGDEFSHFLAPEILRRMSTSLDRAMDLAEDEKVRARLELVEAEFRYLRAMAQVYHMFRAYRAVPSWESLALVEAQVHEFEKTLAWLQPKEGPREPGGRMRLRSPFGTGAPVNRRIEMPDSRPFNWDFGEIRASGELPPPEVEIRIRGGDKLPVYGVPQRRQTIESPGEEDQETDGFIDPSISAPFDM